MALFDWKLVLKTNIFMLRIAGLWPKGVYKLDFYGFYAMISVNLFVGAHVFFQTVQIIFVYTNLEAVAQQVLLSIDETLAIIKIYIFMRNIELLKRLMAALGKESFQPKNMRQVILVQPAIKLWKVVYKTLISAVISCVFLWVAFPVFTNSAKNYVLPFPAWYPYNYRKSWFYRVTYLHQILGIFLLAIGDYNIDTLISALMMFVGAQCDLLCDNLRHLGENSEGFDINVKKCVLHHQEILSFARKCNIFFNFMILAQFFTSSVCLAMALFQLILVTPSSMEFYTFAVSIMSLIMQIFTYCWFGNEVELKSAKIAYAAFESDWTVQPTNVQKSLLIFITRTCYPIKLSTFNLFYLTLSTFTTILRSAFSYFTVLRQLNSPK